MEWFEARLSMSLALADLVVHGDALVVMVVKVGNALVVEHLLVEIISWAQSSVEIYLGDDRLDCVHQAPDLLRAHVLLELLRMDKFLGIHHDLLGALVVFAWRMKCALWTPLVENHISLQVNCRLLKLIEPFGFKQVPHLLLSDLIALLDQLSLVLIEQD